MCISCTYMYQRTATVPANGSHYSIVCEVKLSRMQQPILKRSGEWWGAYFPGCSCCVYYNIYACFGRPRTSPSYFMALAAAKLHYPCLGIKLDYLCDILIILPTPFARKHKRSVLKDYNYSTKLRQ